MYDLDEIWILPLSPVKEEGRSGRKSSIAQAARRAFKNPYLHSLIALYEQVIDPPDVTVGPARKFVLSPRAEDGHGPGRGTLVFRGAAFESCLRTDSTPGGRAAHRYQGRRKRKERAKNGSAVAASYFARSIASLWIRPVRAREQCGHTVRVWRWAGSTWKERYWPQPGHAASA
jgi:hypothetical protein